MKRKPKLFEIGKHENVFENPADNGVAKVEEYILLKMKIEEKEKDIHEKSQLRDYVLSRNLIDESLEKDIESKWVIVEVLDFDWMFQNNNAEALI